MICPNCNSKIPEKSTICPECMIKIDKNLSPLKNNDILRLQKRLCVSLLILTSFVTLLAVDVCLNTLVTGYLNTGFLSLIFNCINIFVYFVTAVGLWSVGIKTMSGFAKIGEHSQKITCISFFWAIMSCVICIFGVIMCISSILNNNGMVFTVLIQDFLNSIGLDWIFDNIDTNIGVISIIVVLFAVCFLFVGKYIALKKIIEYIYEGCTDQQSSFYDYLVYFLFYSISSFICGCIFGSIGIAAVSKFESFESMMLGGHFGMLGMLFIAMGAGCGVICIVQCVTEKKNSYEE